jgi:hypothetical protein
MVKKPKMDIKKPGKRHASISDKRNAIKNVKWAATQ